MDAASDVWQSDDRLPIALIIDDPMPCVNPLYYFYVQVEKQPDPPYAPTIPLELLERFIELVQARRVRGDFSVVPYPAGLGSIAEGLSGFDDRELQRWLDLVRQHLAEAFDIHPEILTHTLALDLRTRKMRDISEHDWMGRQDEATLTPYFVEAMSILKTVGLPNHGITQPCAFTGDQDAYARAILAAEQAVNGRSQTHYFLDILPEEPRPLPYCRLADPQNRRYVVSIPSGHVDAFWPANDGRTDWRRMADYYITDDGRSGRMIELLQRHCPLIFHTHWQSLYGNGSYAGLSGLELLLERIETHIGHQVRWMRISEISDLTIGR